jgi:Dyp-type peroxidase family
MDESILTKEGLSYNSPEFEKIAKDIQGNILKGHARDHVTLLFFTFNPENVNEAKTWLHTFGTTQLTTAAKQKEQAQLYHAKKEQTLFFGLYLSASCYNYLGLDPKKPNDFQLGKAMTDASVMADLEDPSVSKWEENWQKPIHGCVLMAYGDYNDDRTKLDLMAQSIKNDLDAIGYCFLQKGDSLKKENINIEHFGYADGISQPLFFVEQLDAKSPNSFSTWHPMALLNLALVPDNFNSFGSYWVFRKLEQNVKAFKENEAEIAKSQGLVGKAGDIVGARIVGRYENGMPIAVSEEDDAIKGVPIPPDEISQINNFNYPAGSRCPVHAHIRKVNKRTKDFPRIVRRGIPYDERLNKEDKLPTKGVGLLFQCFQSNIENQFEAIQKVANDDPKDLVIGCPEDNKYVKLKGGGYFFAPSRLFFESLNPIFSQRNLIENMKTPSEKGVMGNFPGAKSSIPVYYANMVSHLILDQLRKDIRKIVDDQLKVDVDTGTINQVIRILTSRNPDLIELQRKAAKINDWYETNHPEASTLLETNSLKEGGDFEFTPNAHHASEYPNHKPKPNGKVAGARLVQCLDGLCCASDQDSNSIYFVAPSSSTVDNAEIEHTSDDNQWHIYEADKGTSLSINIEGENYSFTA